MPIIKRKKSFTCSVCGRPFQSSQDVYNLDVISSVVKERILNDYPKLKKSEKRNKDLYICPIDLSVYRLEYVKHAKKLEEEEQKKLESEVLGCLRDHEITSKNIEAEFDKNWNWHQRLADKIASFGGSWSFIVFFFSFLIGWVILNTIILVEGYDKYPFILLNLILSCIAAIQAPVIMMSQNRQEAKDRKRAQKAFQINLKAELEVRLLNDKIDYLIKKLSDNTSKIQEIQTNILSEIATQLSEKE